MPVPRAAIRFGHSALGIPWAFVNPSFVIPTAGGTRRWRVDE
jgi:hypothetical protein